MGLYTGKGDHGTSTTFNSLPGQRLPKSDTVFETLGTVDELNSILGVCKLRTQDKQYRLGITGPFLHEIVHNLQKDLFIVQAELAGADKFIDHNKVGEMEHMIAYMETVLPPITTFFIAGGCELSTQFDVARTVARRAERRMVAASESGVAALSKNTKQYMNRLSSILYALARLSNHLSGINEAVPDYR